MQEIVAGNAVMQCKVIQTAGQSNGANGANGGLSQLPAIVPVLF